MTSPQAIGSGGGSGGGGGSDVVDAAHAALFPPLALPARHRRAPCRSGRAGTTARRHMIGSGARRRFAYATAPMMRPRSGSRDRGVGRIRVAFRRLARRRDPATFWRAPSRQRQRRLRRRWLWSHALLRHPSPRRPPLRPPPRRLSRALRLDRGAADSIELLREASRLNQLTPKELLQEAAVL